MNIQKDSHIMEVNRESNTMLLKIYTIMMVVGIISFALSQLIGDYGSKHSYQSLLAVDAMFAVFAAIPYACRKLNVREAVITHILSILFVITFVILTYYTFYSGAATVWAMGGLLLLLGSFYLNRTVLVYASIGSGLVLFYLLAAQPVQNLTIDLGDHVGRFAIMGLMVFIAFKANAQYTRTLKRNFEQYEEIQKTNTKLRESEEKFHRIFASSPSLILITSIGEGEIIDCNKTFLENFGYEKAEVIGKKTSEIGLWTNSEDRSELVGNLGKLEGIWNYEASFRTKAGDIRHYILSCEVVVLNGADRIVSAMFDITEKKKAEEELLALKSELEERVEARTQDFKCVLEEVSVINEKLFNAGKIIRRKNKELEENYSKLVDTQKQLVQKEKMAGVGQLAAGVAHEINNPLGYIIGNTETLKSYLKRLVKSIRAYQEFKENLSSAAKEEMAEMLDILEKYEEDGKIEYILKDIDELFLDTFIGLERVKAIVSALRKFSHVDKNEAMTEYDLNDGINNMLVIANNEIRYAATVEKSLGNIPRIHAAGGEISQVLLNLLINALHAIKSKNDGTGKIAITTYEKHGFIFCDIEDNGVGMDEDTLHRIYEPFYTTKPVGDGTGLGLSLAYDVIVKKHKGDIMAESALGTGTKFTIKLPAVPTV